MESAIQKSGNRYTKIEHHSVRSHACHYIKNPGIYEETGAIRELIINTVCCTKVTSNQEQVPSTQLRATSNTTFFHGANLASEHIVVAGVGYGSIRYYRLHFFAALLFNSELNSLCSRLCTQVVHACF
jgi:hypothetical protein